MLKHLEMKNTTLSLLVLINLCFFSCGERQERIKGAVDIASAMLQPGEIKASDYFQEIQYIPLETNNESLVGGGATIRIIGDYLLITTTQRQCLLFDKKTGNYLRSIGHIGNDPQGYRSVDCVMDEKNERLYFPGWHSNMIVYSLSGDYLGILNYPTIDGRSYQTMQFTSFSGDTLVALLNTVDYHLAFFNSAGEPISTLTNKRMQPIENVDMNHVAFHGGFMGDAGIRHFGPPAVYGMVFLKTQNDQELITQLQHPLFWNFDGETRFKELFVDTIYQVSIDKTEPYLTFNLGEYAWPYADQYKIKPDNRIFISQVLEGKNTLLFRFITGLHNWDGGRTLYNGVYHKATGKTQVDLLDVGIMDDLTNFLPLQPLAISSSGEYIGMLLAEEVAIWFADNPDKISALPDKVKALQEIDAEDNPVIVLLR